MIFREAIIKRGFEKELDRCFDGKFVRRDTKKAIYEILEQLFAEKVNCMESEEFAKFSLLRYELMQDMDIKHIIDIIDSNIEKIEHITRNVKGLYNNPYHLLLLLTDGVFDEVYEAFRKNHEEVLSPFDIELVQKILGFMCSFTEVEANIIINYVYDINENKDIEEEFEYLKEIYGI